MASISFSAPYDHRASLPSLNQIYVGWWSVTIHQQHANSYRVIVY